MATFVEVGIEFRVVQCGNCGIHFGLPQWFDEEHKTNGNGFYCPNGHPRAYAEFEPDRLRREHEKTMLSMQALLNEEKHARVAAERAVSTEKARYTRMKNRVAHGICPCCNKTFKDLSNHMVTEHKDFRLEGRERKRITSA